MAVSEFAINPNHVACVPDTSASSEQVSQATWLKSRGIKVEDRVRLSRLSHMRYQTPDLEALCQFMLDFGMVIAKKTENEAWFRGYGAEQYVYYAIKGPKKFLGGVFAVDSKEEFEKTLKIPGASQVQDLSDAPGGGQMVTIEDPDGFPFNVMFGQTRRELTSAGIASEKLTANYPYEKQRVRRFNRFDPGPAAVHKLGHFGYSTTRFEELFSFYSSHFNLVPSDILYMEAGGNRIDVTTFMHLDLGQNLTDHHCFFIGANPTGSHVHHCSFEVFDFDTQHLGHEWLAKKGYDSVWGVGRHILGSQIFDYWWDPARNMVEHYADGDLVNEDTPIGILPAGHESLAIWGPEVPLAFLQ